LIELGQAQRATPAGVYLRSTLVRVAAGFRSASLTDTGSARIVPVCRVGDPSFMGVSVGLYSDRGKLPASGIRPVIRDPSSQTDERAEGGPDGPPFLPGAARCASWLRGRSGSPSVRTTSDIRPECSMRGGPAGGRPRPASHPRPECPLPLQCPSVLAAAQPGVATDSEGHPARQPCGLACPVQAAAELYVRRRTTHTRGVVTKGTHYARLFR